MRYQQITSPETRYYSSAEPPRLSWPDAVAYRESVQTPHLSLADPELRSSGISLDRRGLPVAYAGRFAVVFKLAAQNGEKWALRCFTTPGDDQGGAARANRYRLIQQYVDANRTVFVPFRYLEHGIKCGPDWYPVLAMRWANGEPLGRWVERHRGDPAALRTLCGSLTALLTQLEQQGLSHGDWQHDNLLVADNGRRVTLVDYDGMYVPEMKGQTAPEIGHPNYQHPARTAEHFGPGLDRFACLVIQTALLGLAQDPTLWDRFSDGESLLFKKVDFTDPEVSPLFYVLRNLAEDRQDETLADAIARVEDACRAGAMSTLLPAIAGIEAPGQLAYEPIPPVDAVSATVPLNGHSESNVGKNGAGEIRRWWMMPESVVRTQRQMRPRTAAMSSQDEFLFIERVNSEEIRRAEERHLWSWRFGAGVLLTTLLTLIYLAIRSGDWYLFAFFGWTFNLATLGYTNWPRKKIYDELVKEIEKMETLIANRNKEIAEKASVTSPSRQNVSDFIAERLRQTSINRLYKTGVTISVVRQLHEAGIENALELRRHTFIPQVPPHQITALQNWCRELEMEAAAEYRKTVGASRSIPADLARLRHEVAEFERHVGMLKRERDLFPDVTLGTYFSRLLGGDGVGGAAAPPAP
jgi:hypothetical protein